MQGTTIGVISADTRSLDYNLYGIPSHGEAPICDHLRLGLFSLTI